MSSIPDFMYYVYTYLDYLSKANLSLTCVEWYDTVGATDPICFYGMDWRHAMSSKNAESHPDYPNIKILGDIYYAYDPIYLPAIRDMILSGHEVFVFDEENALVFIICSSDMFMLRTVSKYNGSTYTNKYVGSIDSEPSACEVLKDSIHTLVMCDGTPRYDITIERYIDLRGIPYRGLSIKELSEFIEYDQKLNVK